MPYETKETAVPPLTTHHAGDHDRLGFHPECPVCRQDRLFGVLSPEPVFSRRLRVLLVTGVLAFSTAATGTSVATEPENQQEGVVAPEQGAPPSGNPSGDATPDGSADDLGQGSEGETALPFEVDPVPAAPQDGLGDDDSADAAPLETEPIEDPDAGLLLTGPDTPATLNADDSPVPPAEPAPPITPSLPSAPPPAAGAPTGPDVVTPPAADGDQGRRVSARGRTRHAESKHQKRGQKGRRQRVHRKTERVDDTPPAPMPVETSAQPVAQLTESAATPDTPPPPAGRFGRFHVVRRGESLWSIATDLLGPGASASAIALEVRRLWGLNEARIGTGDPNLLVIGVRLRLR